MTKGGLPKYAHKRDGNEHAIRRTLEAVGFQIVQLSATGLPDLIVNGVNQQGMPDSWFMEVKSAKGQLTDAQNDTLNNWQGKPIHIVRTEEEALAIVGF